MLPATGEEDRTANWFDPGSCPTPKSSMARRTVARRGGSAALRALGNTTIWKEEMRECGDGLTRKALWQYYHSPARMFARNPGFVIVAAVSLALGIGANAAMFALVNTLLIKPLPYAELQPPGGITGPIPRPRWTVPAQSRDMGIASIALAAGASNLTGMARPCLSPALRSPTIFSPWAPRRHRPDLRRRRAPPRRRCVVILSLPPRAPTDSDRPPGHRPHHPARQRAAPHRRRDASRVRLPH